MEKKDGFNADILLNKETFIAWIKESIGSGDLEALLRDIINAELVTLVDGDIEAHPDMLGDDDAVEDFANILANYLVGEE